MSNDDDTRPKDLKRAVFEALGEASMCWNPRPSTAEFDSTHCSKVGDELLRVVEENVQARVSRERASSLTNRESYFLELAAPMILAGMITRPEVEVVDHPDAVRSAVDLASILWLEIQRRRA